MSQSGYRVGLRGSLFVAVLVASLVGLPVFASGGGAGSGSAPKFDSTEAEAEYTTWFTKQPTVDLANLQPGDILLKKAYWGGSMVIGGQAGFRASVFDTDQDYTKKAKPEYWNYLPSKYTSHAALYLGNDLVAEATPHADPARPELKGGVLKRPFTAMYRGTCFLAFRPRDAAVASAAVEWASATAVPYEKNTPLFEYSTGDCLNSAFHSASFGSHAKGNIRDRVKGDPKKNWNIKSLMCSEFVSYCLQNSDTPIQLDAQYTSPMRLEEYLKKSAARVLKKQTSEAAHPEFEFLGVFQVPAN